MRVHQPHIHAAFLSHASLPTQLKTIKPLCDKAEKLAAALPTASTSTPAVAAIAAAETTPGPAPIQISEEPTLSPPPLKESKTEPVHTSAPAGVLKKTCPLRTSEPVVSVAAVQLDEGAEEPVMRASVGKDAREKKHGKMKWVLEDPKETEGHLHTVSEQLEPILGASVHAALFARDFKKQIEGLKELSAFVVDHHAELISNLDLVLKMCSLRFAGRSANTSVVLAVLELLRTTFQALVESEYRYFISCDAYFH